LNNYNDILQIPERAIIKKRVTKSFFLNEFNLTLSEKKVLTNQIEKMQWLASVKPATTNINKLITGNYIYEEIQFFVCSLSPGSLKQHHQKCIELFQKNIPYQIVLIVEDDSQFVMNTCDKRINLSDKNKRTIVEHYTTPIISKLYQTKIIQEFYNGLKFSSLDVTNLQSLYKSYIRAITQLKTAQITGKLTTNKKSRTDEDLKLLLQIENLEDEINSMVNESQKKYTIRDTIDLKMKIEQKKSEIKTLKHKLVN